MPKLTDAAITKATALSANDRLYIVDVSDTTHDPAGTSKYIEVADLRKIPPQSATITYTDGRISQVVKGGVTYALTYDSGGRLEAISNGTHHWAFGYSDDVLTSVTITEE